jgi:SAM-dependent methyltransferase
MSFANAYEDPTYAAAYAQLDFPGTYALAGRELPPLLARHATGKRALDFGCGAGRSTRLLRALGFDAVGVDVSDAMVALARRADPEGDYRVLPEHDPSPPLPAPVDLVLCAWPFDNIPGWERKVNLVSALRRALAPGGRVFNLVSSPEIYVHEWVSFTTRDFPENHAARTGDVVRIIGRSLPDERPVEDILWSEAAWQEVYLRAGLQTVEVCSPLARGDEGIDWLSETSIPPWTVHVLAAEEAPC